MEQGDKMNDTENSSCSPESSGNIVVYATDGNPADIENLRMSAFSMRKAMGGDVDMYLVTESGINPGIEGMCVVNPKEALDSVGFFPDKWNRPWPYAVLYRLAIPLMPEFSEFDRVLYIDTDTLVFNDDIKSMFSIDDEGFEIAGVKDINGKWGRIARMLDTEIDRKTRNDVMGRVWAGRSVRNATYVNGGVLMMFLDNIRDNGLDWYRRRLESFWEAEKKGMVKYLDQDFVNSMMKTGCPFDQKFNSFAIFRGKSHNGDCIAHFIKGSKSQMPDLARGLGYVK